MTDTAATPAPPQIWVDADACPAPVKEILFRAAERAQVEVRQAALDIDEEVRGYFKQVLHGAAPWYLRPALPLQRFVTRGLLPPAMREAFGLPWSSRDEQRWRKFQHWAPRMYWALPRWIRHLPARYHLRLMKRDRPTQ